MLHPNNTDRPLNFEIISATGGNPLILDSQTALWVFFDVRFTTPSNSTVQSARGASILVSMPDGPDPADVQNAYWVTDQNNVPRSILPESDFPNALASVPAGMVSSEGLMYAYYDVVGQSLGTIAQGIASARSTDPLLDFTRLFADNNALGMRAPVAIVRNDTQSVRTFAFLWLSSLLFEVG
jgi:hypothetical protein